MCRLCFEVFASVHSCLYGLSRLCCMHSGQQGGNIWWLKQMPHVCFSFLGCRCSMCCWLPGQFFVSPCIPVLMLAGRQAPEVSQLVACVLIGTSSYNKEQSVFSSHSLLFILHDRYMSVQACWRTPVYQKMLGRVLL